MNSRNYRKLPRHYKQQSKFHLELTDNQAQILSAFLPKGCTLAHSNQTIKQTKPNQLQTKVNLNINIHKQANPNININKQINYNINKQTKFITKQSKISTKQINANSNNTQSPLINNRIKQNTIHKQYNNKLLTKSAIKKQQQMKTNKNNLNQKKLNKQNKDKITQLGSNILKKGVKQQQLSQQLYKNTIKILSLLNKSQYSWPFQQPVDPIALGIPQYLKIIKEPMDLETMQTKLKQKKYKCIQQFNKDINKIINNSYLFNQGNQDFIKITNNFQAYYNQISKYQYKQIQNKGQNKIENNIKQNKLLQKDKKRQKQQQKQLKQIQKQKNKQLKQQQKIKQKQLKQKQKQSVALNNMINKKKKKKKGLSKDIIQAQNIPLQQKLQLAQNIQTLPKQYIKGIKQIAFNTNKAQGQQNNQLHPIVQSQEQFDIERIGYKKIRQLQKYVKNKLIQIQNKQNKIQKKTPVNLDDLQSEWTQQFIQ